MHKNLTRMDGRSPASRLSSKVSRAVLRGAVGKVPFR